MGSFSIWHWLIVLVIIALVFGTRKLRNVGEDLGSAIKSFRKGMQDGDAPPSQLKADPPAPNGATTGQGAPSETKADRTDS